jgi:hypothetical protein
MTRVTRLIVGIAATTLVAACSSSGSHPASPPPFDAAVAKQQITANWQTFFDSTKPVSAKLGLLQEAPRLKPVLEAEAHNPLTRGASARVTAVVISADHKSASVTYDLLTNGQTSLAKQTGTAVYENGSWKVSKATFCGLANLEAQFSNSSPPAVCA